MSLFVRSEKDQKYDRQTRMWGSHGQAAIELAHVCSLGSGAVATETLKNLVLPAVGNITVVDDAKVVKSDLGVNFFLEQSSLGKPRAEETVKFLVEMNEDCKGHSKVASPEQVAGKDKLGFFDAFSLVLVERRVLSSKALARLSAHLFAKGTPLVVVTANGFLGSVRLAVPDMLVTETHYDNDRHNLFVHPEAMARFPELQRYCDEFKLGAEELKAAGKDSSYESHVPYIAILTRVAKTWMKAHDGKLPRSMAEKREFKAAIQELASDFAKFENFGEALQFAFRVYARPELDYRVQAVLDHDRCNNLKKDSPNFWVLARAVRNFIQKEGAGFEPVVGEIPDITCKTADFVRLQNIFRAKAAADLALVTAHVHALLKGLGRAENAIPAEEIKYFVNNFKGINAVHYRSLAQEMDASAKAHLSEISNEEFEEYDFSDAAGEDGAAGGDEEKKPKIRDIEWYWTMRGAEAFRDAKGRYPGEGAKLTTAELAADAKELHEIVSKQLAAYEVRTKPNPAASQELTRFGGAQVHATAAFLGGVAAQVALKVTLRQFIPLNNTLVYNGILGREKAFEV